MQDVSHPGSKTPEHVTVSSRSSELRAKEKELFRRMLRVAQPMAPDIPMSDEVPAKSEKPKS